METFLKESLLHQYEEILHLLEDLPEDFILANHIPEKWSIHENLCHLGRYQEVFHRRMEKILLEDTPDVGRYVPTEDPGMEAWLTLSTKEVLTKTQAFRKAFAQQFISFSQETLTRKGTHPLLGSMQMKEWLHFFILHEKHHIYTIFKLKMHFR